MTPSSAPPAPFPGPSIGQSAPDIPIPRSVSPEDRHFTETCWILLALEIYPCTEKLRELTHATNSTQARQLRDLAVERGYLAVNVPRPNAGQRMTVAERSRRRRRAEREQAARECRVGPLADVIHEVFARERRLRR